METITLSVKGPTPLKEVAERSVFENITYRCCSFKIKAGMTLPVLRKSISPQVPI